MIKKFSNFQFFFQAYLVIYFLLSLIFLFNSRWSIYSFFLISYSLLPVIFVLSKSKRVILLLATICTLCISYAITLTSSKVIRSFFPPPKILEGKIIGFAQYYGYPFLFDYFFVFEIIFIPIIVIILFSSISKKYVKKNL